MKIYRTLISNKKANPMTFKTEILFSTCECVYLYKVIRGNTEIYFYLDYLSQISWFTGISSKILCEKQRETSKSLFSMLSISK